MLEIGKLDSELLEKIIFDNINFRRPEVITRPGIGEDCAVIEYGEYECVTSTDPITASIKDIGRLSVHISCNDVASNGVEPIGILLCVLLPKGTTEEDINEMMRQAGEASRELGVEIIGGHTEVTAAVKQPVITSTAIGRGPRGGSQHASDMKEGDYILMTKKAGLEGTAIIATEFSHELESILTAEEISKAKDMLSHISVVKEGVIAGSIGTRGMHDVTEGGVLGAVWEMCSIGKVGAEIKSEDIPVDPVTVKICSHYGIDHRRLISSGSMMIMAPPEKKDAITDALKNASIEVSCIGRITAPGEPVMMDGKEVSPPEADEIYKVVNR